MNEERAETALRTLLAERAAGVTAPAGIAARARARSRVRRRMAVAASAAAAVVVGAGLPVGIVGLTLSSPAPAPGPPTATYGPDPAKCFGNPNAHVGRKPPSGTTPPAFPAQSGVRGSLAGDADLVRRVLTAGWADMQGQESRTTPDLRTLRLQFLEQAGPGFVGLVTVADRTGRWHTFSWVTGRGDRAVAIDGGGVRADAADGPAGLRIYGSDPLFVGSQVVCGQRYAVALGPPDSTASFTNGFVLDPDATVTAAPDRPMPGRDGLALQPVDFYAVGRITIRRGGTQLARAGLPIATPALGDPRRYDPAIIARAVDTAPPGQHWLAKEALDQPYSSTLSGLNNAMTGARVLWAGEAPPGHDTVLTEVTLSGGAHLVSAYAARDLSSTQREFGDTYTGYLPADRPETFVYAWETRGGVGMYANAAARAEVVVPGRPTLTPALTHGGGIAVLPAGVAAKDVTVRLFTADGRLLGERVPGEGLLPGNCARCR